MATDSEKKENQKSHLIPKSHFTFYFFFFSRKLYEGIQRFLNCLTHNITCCTASRMAYIVLCNASYFIVHDLSLALFFVYVFSILCPQLSVVFFSSGTTSRKENLFSESCKVTS